MNLEHEQVETVIVGGSQSGLAVGQQLKERGRSVVILDAHDRVGDAWRRRWESLRLFTPARYSGLPGMPFPAPPRSYPTKDEVADYLETYAERFELPIMTGVTVDHVSRRGTGFEVVAGERTFCAANVVIATGASHTPRIPALADRLDPAILQLHSSAYREPSQLQEGDVLVVGAGNSGAEIALEVSRSHRTWLSGRHPGQEPTRAGSVPDRLLAPLMWFVASRVLTVGSPVGRRVHDRFFDPPRGIPLGRIRRRDLAAAGIERVPRTEDTNEGCPMLGDGRTLVVANVIWCTGYLLDLSWLDPPLVGDQGSLTHERGVVTSLPGLYIVGLPFLHSLSSGLVGGVGADATHIADHLAARMEGRPATHASA